MDTVLISVSEIALKSRPVRSRLERRLAQQARFLLSREGFADLHIQRMQGRLCIETAEPEKAAEALAKRLFGAATVMPATRTTTDLNEIMRTAVETAVQTISPNESFAVRPKNVGEHPYSSRELAVKIGAEVLEKLKEKGVHVDLDEPDRVMHVEAREDASFVYTRVLRGLGGLPYGSQGRLVALFSGGIDSPVAAWMMMKRGASVVPLFLDQRPYVGEDYYLRALEAARIIGSYVPAPEFSLYTINFHSVMERIMACREPSLRCVLCKRAMYRAASAVAYRQRAQGLVTGESLGQVASQTLPNLTVLSEAASMPLYRPLIGFDKVEIEQMAKTIGTYEATAKKVEGCTVVPSRPKTKTVLEKVKKAEEELGLAELVAEAATQTQRIRLFPEESGVGMLR
jgi:thiamine biosynthesis protein ThiI